MSPLKFKDVPVLRFIAFIVIPLVILILAAGAPTA